MEVTLFSIFVSHFATIIMVEKIGQNLDSITYFLPKNSIITETMLDLKFSAH